MNRRNQTHFALRRAIHRWNLTQSGLFIILWCAVGRAEATPSKYDYSRLVVGVSGNVGIAFGQSFPVTANDYVFNRDAITLTGVRLMPRWRSSEQWAFGLNTGLVMHGQYPLGPTDWWDAQAEVRLYPLVSSAPALWLAGTAGMILAVDRARAAAGTEGGPDRPAETYNTLGPAASVGIGVDSIKDAHISVGTEIRAVFYGLSASSTPSNHWGPTYSPYIGFTLGVTISLEFLRTH